MIYCIYVVWSQCQASLTLLSWPPMKDFALGGYAKFSRLSSLKHCLDKEGELRQLGVEAALGGVSQHLEDRGG